MRKRGKTQWEKPPVKMNTESSLNHPDELSPNSEHRKMKLFSKKYLGEDVCNLLISLAVLQNDGLVMH